MAELKTALLLAKMSTLAFRLPLIAAMALSCCLQTNGQQASTENKLHGKVEKLGGDGRIVRPVHYQLSSPQPAKTGAGIFTPSNFDLSVNKSPAQPPQQASAAKNDRREDDFFKKEANVEKQNLSTQLQTQAKPSGLAPLKDYDVFFLIDCSGSMNTPDCPSKDPQEPVSSRWEWTGEEIKKFTAETHEILKQGVTIILYNAVARKIENCHEKELSEIFTNTYPDGATLLARPLHEALNRQFNSKPCFVIVIGDGAASDQQDVEHELFLAASAADADKKLKILMTQVGEDVDSHIYRGSAENATWMINKSPITKYVPFRELKTSSFGKIIETMITQH